MEDLENKLGMKRDQNFSDQIDEESHGFWIHNFPGARTQNI